MTEQHGTGEHGESRGTDGLVDELDLLEQQPLEERAEQLARIHDRLQAELGAVRG
ncbi:hypothetical protein [Agrococcus baldri]|uniref:Uncharacterized protein n=1 Tax=Agrococcus baldri TaxID=153730 RepID=A0AA87UXF8_9MICO|nr:hypothetical protein [Agrococcus baldri]GEK80372.1 hypothetical protein ABA31_17230 [Agrococcus baldri]